MLVSSLKRKFTVFAGVLSALLFCVPVLSAPSASKKAPDRRIAHARELMGSRYERSVVAKSEEHEDVTTFVRSETKRNLHKKWHKQADKIAGAILRESERHGFDPIFLMAVIQNESSFRLDVRGGAGEIGLMQIMPRTGKWICEKMGWQWKGERTLQDPVMNIRIGAVFLSMLREKFDRHGQLYLAAYNMGPPGVRRALGKKIWPKDYAMRVMERYLAFYRGLQPVRNLASRNAVESSNN